MELADTTTLGNVDSTRRSVASGISRQRKSELGQFMTPSSVAGFMATLFKSSVLTACRVLDAGAGVGSLSAAFLDRWGESFQRIDSTAFEIDDALRPHLIKSLEVYSKRFRVALHIEAGDFIEQAVNRLQFSREPGFTHAILNPPYKKIGAGSRHRLLLREVGIETVNLYTAFVALTLELMAPGGQVVAIIPRSFCNGPYYRPFREFMLRRSAIRQMHLFDSRNQAFKEEQVLQENIIIALECGAVQGQVMVSTSTDDTFGDYAASIHPFERIVFPTDAERFIHVPTSTHHSSIERSRSIRHTLKEIGVTVSTGPVVDFRLRRHLRGLAGPGTVPLLYPGHFSGPSIEWPKVGFKKANAIARNDETERWLYPSGFYAVVRRFSSKEERRRIVASVVDPRGFSDADVLGFENHLNVFHEARRGLPEDLAHGLALFLNGTAVDEHFRRFSGHTQVNATDLRAMKFPSRAQLIALGKWAKGQAELTQEAIDERLTKLE